MRSPRMGSTGSPEVITSMSSSDLLDEQMIEADLAEFIDDDQRVAARGSRSRRFSRLVFPAPKKPVTMVSGKGGGGFGAMRGFLVRAHWRPHGKNEMFKSSAPIHCPACFSGFLLLVFSACFAALAGGCFANCFVHGFFELLRLLSWRRFSRLLANHAGPRGSRRAGQHAGLPAALACARRPFHGQRAGVGGEWQALFPRRRRFRGGIGADRGWAARRCRSDECGGRACATRPA